MRADAFFATEGIIIPCTPHQNFPGPSNSLAVSRELGNVIPIESLYEL